MRRARASLPGDASAQSTARHHRCPTPRRARLRVGSTATSLVPIAARSRRKSWRVKLASQFSPRRSTRGPRRSRPPAPTSSPSMRCKLDDVVRIFIAQPRRTAAPRRMASRRMARARWHDDKAAHRCSTSSGMSPGRSRFRLGWSGSSQGSAPAHQLTLNRFRVHERTGQYPVVARAPARQLR
jgi:hypothetical protein